MKLRIIKQNNKFHLQNRCWFTWYTFHEDIDSLEEAEKYMEEVIAEHNSSPSVIKNYSV
jgi:hypothetical protein